MKVGLFFGSFNPIHVGHLVLANHMVEYTDLEEVWFVVTPHNPHKKKASLLNNYDRLNMVELATNPYEKFRTSNVEFSLKQPSYTIDTLVVLSEKNPQHEFSLIMGSDNLKSFPKWKNFEQILENYRLLLYPRPGNTHELINHENIQSVEAPQMAISATYIRQCIKENKNIRPLVPPSVFDFLDGSNLYKN